MFSHTLDTSITLPDTNMAPENGQLEYLFPLQPGLFSEAMLALGSIPHIANPSRQAAVFAPHHSLGPGIQWVLCVNEK